MWTLTIIPRFAETDALGHISNVSYPIWFEQARIPIFKIFTPDLDHKKWKLILARTEVDFVAQAFMGFDIKIKTYLSKIGNASMTIIHEAYQKNKLVAKGLAVMIHFDYGKGKSLSIPSALKKKLQKHLKK